MPLSIKQQYEFIQLASIGCLPFDALVSIGIHPRDAEKMCSDPEVLALHRQGRSQGVKTVRQQLIKAGERGSVSALRALELHREPKRFEEALYPRRPVKPVRVDVLASVDAAFARMRALHEGTEMETTMVEFGKRPKRRQRDVEQSENESDAEQLDE